MHGVCVCLCVCLDQADALIEATNDEDIDDALTIIPPDPDQLSDDDEVNEDYPTHHLPNDIPGTIEFISHRDEEIDEVQEQPLLKAYFHVCNNELVEAGDFQGEEISRATQRSLHAVGHL